MNISTIKRDDGTTDITISAQPGEPGYDLLTVALRADYRTARAAVDTLCAIARQRIKRPSFMDLLRESSRDYETRRQAERAAEHARLVAREPLHITSRGGWIRDDEKRQIDRWRAAGAPVFICTTPDRCTQDFDLTPSKQGTSWRVVRKQGTR